MLKKYVQFSWLVEEKQDFDDVKKVITEALVLKNSNFLKYFITYAYDVEKSIIDILAQKNDQEEEYPIAFHS